MWTAKQLIIAVVMVVTGSINTLSAKWADRTSAPGRVDEYGVAEPHPFNHPFFQAIGMFIGEATCLIAFYCVKAYYRCKNEEFEGGNAKFNPLLFWPASLCDMTATSLMYMGLNLTFASSFQMLRGAVMIFTALLSVAFLGQNILLFMWIGQLLVLIGLALVGVSDFLQASLGITHAENLQDVNGIIAGDLIILGAQVIVATQMVYEQRVLSRYNVHPLQAVGFEGLFGFITLSVLVVIFNYIPAGSKFGPNPQHTLEDPIDGFLQIANSWQIALATIGNVFSIAFFNFAGISVTKELSATTRMVLDSLRTVVIWAFSLAVQWQTFYFLQVIGFALLIVGMCVYNDIIINPMLRKHGCMTPREEATPLVNEGIDERTSLLHPAETA